MGKLIELKDAAKLLGISPEELTEMRDRNEVFGYRDGASWKFKTEEIERVAAQLGSSDESEDEVELSVTPESVGDDLDELIDVAELKLDVDEDDDSESILVTEEELGRSDESTSSTIIGKAGTPLAASESDIKLADDASHELSAAESDLQIADESGLDLDLSSGESDVLTGDSDLLSVSEEGSDVGAGSGDTGKLSLTGDEGSGKAESSLKLAGDDELSLDDDELVAEGDAAGSDLGTLDSSVDLDLDDEDLFASSGTGSDVTLGSSDSGINLANPSDSGISLEDISSDLGSGIDSGLDSSLELGDEDMIELEGELAESEDATELKADDEFLLTPVEGEGGLDDESDDSGSQVIALDSDEFEESAETMLAAEEEGPLVEEDVDFAAAEGIDATAGDVGVGMVAPTATGAAAAQEAEYSVWNVVSLGMVATFLGVSGILVMDLIRNIWSWNGTYSLNSTIMDSILDMF